MFNLYLMVYLCLVGDCRWRFLCAGTDVEVHKNKIKIFSWAGRRTWRWDSEIHIINILYIWKNKNYSTGKKLINKWKVNSLTEGKLKNHNWLSTGWEKGQLSSFEISREGEKNLGRALPTRFKGPANRGLRTLSNALLINLISNVVEESIN